MRKIIIWILLCALLVIIGERAGYKEDSFLMGITAAVLMRIPAFMLDEILD